MIFFPRLAHPRTPRRATTPSTTRRDDDSEPSRDVASAGVHPSNAIRDSHGARCAACA